MAAKRSVETDDCPPDADPHDVPSQQATTARTKDYLGRALITPATAGKDYLGRLIMISDRDYMARQLVA